MSARNHDAGRSLLESRYRTRRNPQIWSIALRTVATVLLLSVRVSAELGSGPSSVYRDAERLNGSVRVRNAAQYSIYEITDSNGTVIREFVSLTGAVFGISWQGRFVPEMRQLLGIHFGQYSAAVQAKTAKYAGRKPLHIDLPDLVFENSGHMGWYYGRVYVPQSVPEGARVEDIR
jgi:hypothetical protein